MLDKDIMPVDLVFDITKTVATESEGDFSFELNDVGELRISNKYEPTTFILTGLAIEKLRRIIPIPLFQIHHQSKADGSCEMVAQSEIRNNDEMKGWEKEVAANHPLPDGKQWLICNEKSKHFVKTVV